MPSSTANTLARIHDQDPAPSTRPPVIRRAEPDPFPLRSYLALALMLLLTAIPRAVCAQTTPAPSPQAQKPAPVEQPMPRVTTTVVVHASFNDSYDSPNVDFGNLDGALIPLNQVPLSISVATRGLLNDLGARVLSDVVKNDASIGEDYAPVGYYGDFQIRGFPLDLATAIQINGMTIAGEQDVPLENKERVEFVKGIAGVESGVASAGGLVNYVTKPVLSIKAFDMATDHRGTSYGSVDLGRLFGGSKGSGIRVNLAGENMHTYVQDANGWRGVGAIDGSWQLNPVNALLADFEYQHRVQRSEAGYQLLGGTTVPTQVFPSVMLGDQSWSKPNTFDVFNVGSRLTHTFNMHWTARLAGSYSHSLIDDNVIWPYGPALDANGNSLCPNSPYYFFCPDGSYEIYDYRSPGELRIDASGDALLQGHFTTGKVFHDFVGGGSLFHRSVDLSPSVVYVPLGAESIYQPNISYVPESPYQQAGPAGLADFNHQAALILQDRARLPGGVMLMAGGRFANVTDFNYDKARKLWLPEYAATYTAKKLADLIGPLTIYANYGVVLSLGDQAPWWVDNANLFLDPYLTRQTEIGAKYERRILLSAALFRMRQPFFYPRVIQSADSFCASNLSSGGNASPGDLCFESAGHETHDGIELSAQGRAASWLQLSASATAIRAQSSQTGTPSFDGKQVINVPHLHTALFADILVPHVRGLHLMPGWSYTGRKEATRDDLVSVPAYNIFNLGARYTPGGESGHVTLRLYADNIFDKRYWKDTGASYGDTFIHLGAPTTVRLSAHYTF
jgi:iron complex outermembrane receptor protein